MVRDVVVSQRQENENDTGSFKTEAPNIWQRNIETGQTSDQVSPNKNCGTRARAHDGQNFERSPMHRPAPGRFCIALARAQKSGTSKRSLQNKLPSCRRARCASRNTINSGPQNRAASAITRASARICRYRQCATLRRETRAPTLDRCKRKARR